MTQLETNIINLYNKGIPAVNIGIELHIPYNIVMETIIKFSLNKDRAAKTVHSWSKEYIDFIKEDALDENTRTYFKYGISKNHFKYIVGEAENPEYDQYLDVICERLQDTDCKTTLIHREFGLTERAVYIIKLRLIYLERYAYDRERVAVKIMDEYASGTPLKSVLKKAGIKASKAKLYIIMSRYHEKQADVLNEINSMIKNDNRNRNILLLENRDAMLRLRFEGATYQQIADYMDSKYKDMEFNSDVIRNSIQEHVKYNINYYTNAEKVKFIFGVAEDQLSKTLINLLKRKDKKSKEKLIQIYKLCVEFYIILPQEIYNKVQTIVNQRRR